MAQRQTLRGASRLFAECQTAFRSVANGKPSGNASFLRSTYGRLHDSPAATGGLAQCMMMHGPRQGAMRVSAFPTTAPMGFAASALPISSPMSILGSVAQHRSVSSTDITEDGDSDDSEPTYLRRAAAGPQSTPSRPEEEPPDLRALRLPREPEAPRRPGPRTRGGGGGGGGPRGGGADDSADAAAVMELVAAAREGFTRLPESSRGPLTSLPREVREAMYGHHWDKVLVDVRRSVERKPLAKEEVYTAMVATGNMAGVVGLGLGVAETAQLAVARAHMDSYSRLVAVPLYRGHTIYHQVDHAYHRMKLCMQPRPEGWGLRCSDLLYELCNVVGIRNISIRLRGRLQNKFYVAQCFLEALQKQTTPHDGVEATGLYIREVYHRKELPCGLKRGVDVM